jgi:hypothetical protein
MLAPFTTRREKMERGKSRKRILTATLRKQLAHIRASEQGGETLKSYADRNGLSVHSLYQAKKQARQQGHLAPHRGKAAASNEPRAPKPPRFVEAVRRTEARDPGSSWRVRFSSGAELESATPLSIEEMLRLVETLGGRA